MPSIQFILSAEEHYKLAKISTLAEKLLNPLAGDATLEEVMIDCGYQDTGNIQEIVRTRLSFDDTKGITLDIDYTWMYGVLKQPGTFQVYLDEHNNWSGDIK